MINNIKLGMEKYKRFSWVQDFGLDHYRDLNHYSIKLLIILLGRYMCECSIPPPFYLLSSLLVDSYFKLLYWVVMPGYAAD